MRKSSRYSIGLRHFHIYKDSSKAMNYPKGVIDVSGSIGEARMSLASLLYGPTIKVSNLSTLIQNNIRLMVVRKY
jgi:spore germination protein GerM